MALINDTRRLRDLDPAFLRRYNLIGPRYTSYPTAPEWSEDFGPCELRDHLEATRADSAGRPLSIYMHLPFCVERCAFCACNVIVSRKGESVSEPYLGDVEREADLYAQHLGGGQAGTERPVVQFHWGGGTPTYLTPDQLRRAHAVVARRFRLAPDAEQSIEIHVTWTTDAQIRVLAELGFNRISMGVQDFNERTQTAIRRRQDPERTRRVVELAREVGFTGVNVDLVYGLPHQTAETFGDTVDRVLELRPDRLAVGSSWRRGRPSSPRPARGGAG